MRNDIFHCLRNLLLLDAATCAVMGAGLSVGAEPVSELTGLPVRFLFFVGLALLPCALVMLLAAVVVGFRRLGSWVVFMGNFAWVIGSVLLPLADWVSPNGAGISFIYIQALAVLILVLLEVASYRKSRPAEVAA